MTLWVSLKNTIPQGTFFPLLTPNDEGLPFLLPLKLCSKDLREKRFAPWWQKPHCTIKTQIHQTDHDREIQWETKKIHREFSRRQPQK